MLEGLHSNYAISGLALQWFRPYLADRHFNVCVRNETSDKCPLKYGVPQGSVLGPLLFTLYIKPLGDIIRRHNVKFHIYADDIQMYYSFDPKSVDSLHNAISVLEKCISEVSQWMVMNKSHTRFTGTTGRVHFVLYLTHFPRYGPSCCSFNFMHFQTSVNRLVDRFTWSYRFVIILQINLIQKICEL